MNFISLMTSTRGRMMRIFMGFVLIAVGLLVVKGSLGTLLAVVAVVPVSGGVFDFCVAGVMLGYPFSGAKARAQIAATRQQATQTRL